MVLQGTAASPGIGIGRVTVIEEADLSYTSRTVEDTAAEVERFNAAIAGYVAYTTAQADTMREQVGEKEAEILTGHVVMIGDPYMQGEMVKLIEGGRLRRRRARADMRHVRHDVRGDRRRADDAARNRRARREDRRARRAAEQAAHRHRRAAAGHHHRDA